MLIQPRARLVLVLLVLMTAAFGSVSNAAPGDTTWVRTFDHDFYNWATAHVDTFLFPDTTMNYQKVLIYYRIGCPGPPADCDPWDRLGYLQVQHDTGEVDTLGQPILEPFELMRVITPYDITGGNRPDSCTWVMDASDYETLLHGPVILSNYIESWIGGDRGWLVTIDFAFIEGEWILEPYQVVNLWQKKYLVSGDPERPEEDVLIPLDVEIDEATVAAKIRTFTTGHGQGNTANCSEFCQRQHTVTANGNASTYNPWRNDCNVNPCSPQGGTWQYPRAGWCPGDMADPYDVDITAYVVPGEVAALDYDLSYYENLCRPNNPDCIPGQTCTDCNYNSTGHTEPHLTLRSQLVLYRPGTLVTTDEDLAGPYGPGLRLGQNTPNPFNPTTWIEYTLPEGNRVTLVITDVGGRVVRRISRRHADGGSYRVLWDGRNQAGESVASGVYFYALEGANTGARKMILVR